MVSHFRIIEVEANLIVHISEMALDHVCDPSCRRERSAEPPSPQFLPLTLCFSVTKACVSVQFDGDSSEIRSKYLYSV